MMIEKYDREGNVIEWIHYQFDPLDVPRDIIELPKNISKEKEKEILTEYSSTLVRFFTDPTPIIEYYDE